MAATIGAAALVLIAITWWTGQSDHSKGDAEVVATGLEVPWGLTFLPAGDALVATPERSAARDPGRGRRSRQVGTVPDVVTTARAGCWDWPPTPRTAASSTPTSPRPTTTGSSASGSARRPDRRADPDRMAKAGNHDGGRLAFGPDGMLYAGVGDAGIPTARRTRTPQRQDPADDARRRCSADNPSPVPWSTAWVTATCRAWPGTRGRLFATEFGQDTWDEVNLIVPGSNYGWPVVEGKSDDPGTEPDRHLATAEACPAGARSRGRPVRGALRGPRLWLVPLDGAATPSRCWRSTAGCARSRRAGRLAVGDDQQPRRPRRPGRGDDRILRVEAGAP